MELKFFNPVPPAQRKTGRADELDLGIPQGPPNPAVVTETRKAVEGVFAASIEHGAGAALKIQIDRALQATDEARKSAKRDGLVSVEG